jgi:1,4-alpha-glucan branching enzyme
MNRTLTLTQRAFSLVTACFLGVGSVAAQCGNIPANQITISPAVYTANTSITVTIDATGTCLAGVPALEMWLFSNVGEASTNNAFCGAPPTEPAATSLGSNRWSFTFVMTSIVAQPAASFTSFGVIFKTGNACGTGPGGNNLQTQDIILTPSPVGGLAVAFGTPAARTQLLTNGTAINFTGNSTSAARLRLYKGLDQTTPLAEVASGTAITLNNYVGANDESDFIRLQAFAGATTVEDTFWYAYRPTTAPAPANPPAGVKDGINYISATSVILQLRAPLKSYVYLLGDFFGWNYSNSYFLRRRADDSDRFWVEITGLTPGRIYRYQYEVDGAIRVPDPFAEQVLDPNNDGFIPNSIYPNRPTYPATGLTTGTVGVFQTNQPAFPWTDNAFRTRPNQLDPRQLNIYELWVHNWSSPYTNTTKQVGSTLGYQNVIDSLQYFKRLGINVIELMPVAEFGGNVNWGYQPNHHSAADKAYGPPTKLKELVNAAHNLGIAVVMDVVFNQTDRDNPVARLWWDSPNNRPAANSPYLNVTATHPFNVFYDFNHESTLTREYVVQTCRWWLDEYHLDGFRFDLSKGFTQTNTGSNVGLWSQRDQSRINIWTYYRNQLRATHPNSWLILEHLADDNEEAELAGLGFWMWGNVVGPVEQSAGGYSSNSNIFRAYHTSRGFANHHLISYSVSHDENRLGRWMQQFAATNGTTSTFYGTAYNPITNRAIRYDRQKAALGMTWLIPGPKMFWMWDEFGYEIDINWCDFQGNINNDCRTNPKPPGWGMINSPGVTGCTNLYVSGCNTPQMLFDTNAVKMQRFTAEIMNLRKTYPVFTTSDLGGSNLDGLLKRLKLTSPGSGTTDFNVIAIANFQTTPTPASIDPQFHTTGTWYEYFNRDSLNVTNVNAAISLLPGEFRLYTSKRLASPRASRLTPYWRVNSVPTANESPVADGGVSASVIAFPNPSANEVLIDVYGSHVGQVSIRLIDLNGREVGLRLFDKREQLERVRLDVSGLGAGMYYLHVAQGAHAEVLTLVKQ